ncbi:M20 family metallo-hydrolase [Oceanobacillus sp. FSL K6-2867]|uniref:M20 family metallo-hydrolase n=1 Tax=Oceanobacillus sp. FSL K6-2867 TaxID=2954748 RepID=UPI0030D9F559
MNRKRFESTLEALNQFGYSKTGINRLAYSVEELAATRYLMELFESEGMDVRMDAVGNVIARRPGNNPELAAVACGSHIDSVYEAGNYDGTVGVIAALEVVRSLNDEAIETEHPIEIIIFACEESARFGYSTLGSKAMAGLLEKEQLTNLQDKNGISMETSFLECGLRLEKFQESKREKGELEVFLELHIEQGPVLEREGKQIGIVTGIAGPTRFKLGVYGKASHSGTTPMNHRRDALLGAAEIALKLEEVAIREASSGTVATVGVFDVKPGAMNIVPGMVEMEIDIRSVSQESKKRVVQELEYAIREAERKRELTIMKTELIDQSPVKLDRDVMCRLQETCEKYGYSYMYMTSGAGHDAMNMATLCPTALIFIPSKDGLSHNPDEYTSLDQISVGVEVLKAELLKASKATEKIVR